VITDAEAVAARAVLMVTEGVVEATDGTRVAVAPESMCVHGDTPHAVNLASRIHAALLAAGVPLTPFLAPAKR
jgi:UPF0271 protein